MNDIMSLIKFHSINGSRMFHGFTVPTFQICGIVLYQFGVVSLQSVSVCVK